MSTPAAWHPDPTGRHDHRWWDGEKWTEHVADAGQASVDPLDAGPAAGSDTGEAAGGGWAGDTATGGGATAGRGEAADAGTAAGGTGFGGTEAGAGGGTDATGHDTGASAWSTPGADAGATGAGAGSQGSGAAPGQASRETQPQQPWDQPAAQPGQWGQPGGQQPPGQWSTQQGWPQSGAPGAARPAGSDGVAIAAMIVGILSLLISFLVLPALGGIIAIILGFVARSRIKQSGQSGMGMAITGIVTGILSVVVAALVALVIGALWGTAGGVFSSYFDCLDETGGDTEFCDRQLEEGLIDQIG